ncbi:MAG: hypothetical protein JWN48_3181 [Myxococcaceae bacterium]|nr:hypothetical protein [Myxococcaceae bacterium]
MQNEKRSAYITREEILSLLSAEEVARVSTAETGDRLGHGEEYLDMKELGQGVRRADGLSVPMGFVLPRSAVNSDTWKTILTHLAARSALAAKPVT